MLHKVSFKSFNQRDDVQGWIYVPAAKPVGIIQLVHGFGEHSRRYLRMIMRFLDAGFIVAADDHVGHGETALVNERWGDWGDQGYAVMREDEHTMTQLVREKFPDLPFFLYGHSMGSFIVRDYIAVYGCGVKAAVLSGTTGRFPQLEQGMNLLHQLVEQGHGEEAATDAPLMLMGWMFGRCAEGVKLGNEWVCADPYVQADHAGDPFNAFSHPTTNRAYLYFCQMIDVITGKQWAEKIPSSLPIYNIAGDQDPVAQYGSGTYQVSNWLIETGHAVQTKIYPGKRHEIHNCRDIRDEVEQGITDFFSSHL